jgi:stage V sporulation protein SpoVS
MEVMKVSRVTDVRKLSGAIIKKWEIDGGVKLSCIGAAAINIAVKAIGKANSYFSVKGKELSFVPSFEVVTIKGEEEDLERTAIILTGRVNDR